MVRNEGDSRWLEVEITLCGKHRNHVWREETGETARQMYAEEVWLCVHKYLPDRCKVDMVR